MEKNISFQDQWIRERVIAHDPEAVRWILEEYGDTMKTVISYHMRCFSKEDQEDCLNEVLFAVWNHMDSFDPSRGSMKNWIAGICRFHALDAVRKQLRRAKEESMDGKENILVSGLEIQTELIEQELSEETEDMLSCLKPVEREILLAFYMEEKTAKELAEEYGLKRTSVYKKMERAKEKIRVRAERRRI